MKKITKTEKRFVFIMLLNVITVSVALILAASFVANQIIVSEQYENLFVSAENKRIIILDAGHGGEDCGAIGINGVYEKNLNYDITVELGEALEREGFVIIFTRTDDKLLYSESENIRGIRKISDLKNRVKIAEQYPDAIFISIHMNSYTSSKYSGFQAYYKSDSEESRLLAEKIQNTVKTNLQSDNNRKIKSGKSIYILENSPITTVLLECGFITNAAECDKLCKKDYQKELSSAIVCGIIEYINEKE